MPVMNVSLTREELKTAIREYLETRGFLTTDRFGVSVRVIPGDRPFDSETVDVTVTGVAVPSAPNKKDPTP